MIVDSSAVVAVFLRQPGWSSLFDYLVSGVQTGIGTATLVETGMVPSARLQRDAVRAFARFGKGRHPAGLNFGDCMSYATARVAGQALLYAGDDFPLTDIERIS